MSDETIPLGQIAHTRSGDKGNHANLGVIAYTPRGYEYLCEELTAQRVAEHFTGLGASRVERFELPGIGALNFVLHDCLAGGASRSLRIDTQGKLLGTAALEIPLSKPADLEEMLRWEGEARAEPARHESGLARSFPARQEPRPPGSLNPEP